MSKSKSSAKSNISPSRWLAKFFHLVGLAHYYYALYYDFNYIVIPEDQKHTLARPGFGGRSRFLTYWSLVRKVKKENYSENNYLKYLR